MDPYRRVLIKNTNMPEDMEKEAIHCAEIALEGFNMEIDIAKFIKREFDKLYKLTWHCIVGRKIDYSVDAEHLIYFYIGQCCFLLFKNK